MSHRVFFVLVAVICLLSEEYAGRKEYDAAPWARLAPQVQCGRLPGQHNTCVSTHVDVLAQRLNQEFSEPTAQPGLLAE